VNNQIIMGKSGKAKYYKCTYIKCKASAMYKKSDNWEAWHKKNRRKECKKDDGIHHDEYV